MKPKRVIITAERQFELKKPRFNAHQTGHGIHKSKKAYSRKQKHKYA